MLLKRLIIFLVRKKLGLKKYQTFKFDNQKTDAVYWFSSKTVVKALNGDIIESSVSLNWLLNDECKITPVVDI
jgi:hypothetical protein